MAVFTFSVQVDKQSLRIIDYLIFD